MKSDIDKKNETAAKKPKADELKKLKKPGVMMALLPLAACNSDGINPETLAPAFIENPTGTFIATNNKDTTLEQGAATADLIVSAKGGNDIIHTGSGDDIIDGGAGNDMIRAGEGADTITAGAGDDAIVVVGTTGASEYTTSSITNSGGTGVDLSSLITLADLNGRTVSEVEAGESIDGGAGTNTLYIYGTVDLTGVTLSNVTVLVVNSDVTLSPEQIARFTTVDGDGSSVINIEIPEGSTDNYVLDLSILDMSDVATINIDGDLTVQISDVDDLGGVTEIISTGTSEVTLDIAGDGSNTVIDVEEIADVFETVDNIVVQEDVTLIADDADVVATLGLSAIRGTGAVDDGGTDALDNVIFSATGEPTDPNAPPNNPATGDISISGALIEGNDLTATNTLSDADGLGVLFYSWYRDDDFVDNGNSDTYALTADDVGASITVQISFIDGNGNEETHFSPSSEAISAASFIQGPPNTYTATGDVNLTLDQGGSIDALTVFSRGGDDTIITGSGNDVIFGYAGDDTIFAGKGFNTVDGGDGNDSFIDVEASDTIDGGEDYDVVGLSASQDVGGVDFAQLNYSNIEVIDIENIANNTVLVSLQDVINLTDDNNMLIIDGTSDNSVLYANDGWVQGDDVIVNNSGDGGTYNSYTFGENTLLIEENISQSIAF